MLLLVFFTALFHFNTVSLIHDDHEFILVSFSLSRRMREKINKLEKFAKEKLSSATDGEYGTSFFENFTARDQNSK